jgi:hypothetical protein
MPVDLNECKAKIERAREHERSLHAVVDPVVEGDEGLIQVRADLDRESGYHIFRVTAIPEAWRLKSGLIIGDIVHNLRSALDYLFWQLYSAHIRVPETSSEARRVQFPIDDRYEWFAKRRERFSEIPYSLWSVVEAAQPYERLNPATSPLRILRDLSNRDKHQILTPILIRPDTLTFPLPTFRIPGTLSPLNYDHAADYLELGAEVMRTVFPGHADTEEIEGHIKPLVLFPEGDLSLMDGVNWIMGGVEHVVAEIEARL